MEFQTVIIIGLFALVCYLLYSMTQSKDEKTREEGKKFTEVLFKGYSLLVTLGVGIAVIALLFVIGKVLMKWL